MTIPEVKRDPDWEMRERDRFYSSDYQDPVWHGEPWYSWLDENRYCHVSKKDPKMVAFTESEDKGERDIQTMMKPGRFLRKFYPGLSERQVKYWAEYHETGQKPKVEVAAHTFGLATTPEEIVTVYLEGPSSCMSHGERDYSCSGHPVRVYGAGDLAIAYLRGTGDDSDKVYARALVWPDRKVYGRVYPTIGSDVRGDAHLYPNGLTDQEAWHYELESKLQDDGYRSDEESGNGFNGAKLLREVEDGSAVMPYLDRCYGFNDSGEFFTMSRSGAYCGDNTCGLVEIESESSGWCPNCEEDCDADDKQLVATDLDHGGHIRDSQHWCQHCVDHNTFECAGINTLVSDHYAHDEALGTNIWGHNPMMRTYSQRYLDANAQYCEGSESWTFGEVVEMVNGDTWSKEHFDDNGFVCEVSGENCPNEDKHPDHDCSKFCDSEDIEAHYATPDHTLISDARQLELAA